MSLSSSDSSSESLSYTVSETTLFDSVEGCVTKDAQQEKFENQVDSDESTASLDTPKIPDYFIKIKGKQRELTEQLEEANKEIAQICSKHLKMRQNDALANEESLRNTATALFFYNTDNRYFMRQDYHDQRMGRLKEEQLLLEEYIFGPLNL